MSFIPLTLRCKNCKTKFTQRRTGQIYCKPKCRNEFHNYGATPIEQLKRRLAAYMRTPEFKTLLRQAIAQEMKTIQREALL